MNSRQKKYISENIGKRSVEDIAKILHVKEKKLRKFLDSEKPSKPVMIIQRDKIQSKYVSAWVAILALIILGISIYANSLGNEFVYDDIGHVEKNPLIRSFANIPKAFTHSLLHFVSDEANHFYRPIQTITYMADYFLWGLDPSGYHITNALLHILACILLFGFLSCVTGNNMLSALVSLLYLAHPLHTEAVSYISGRADSMCSIFLFTSLICQYKYWHSKRYKKVFYYMLSFASFVLALLSKEAAIIFPFLMILFEYCVRSDEGYSRIKIKNLFFYMPFFIFIALWSVAYNIIIPSTVMLTKPFPLALRTIIASESLLNYIKLSFFPLNLHMEYIWRKSQGLFHIQYIYSPVITILLLLFVRNIWKKGKANINCRIMFFGLGWFLIALFPNLSIVFPLAAPFSEHWMYIPEAGVILFVVYALSCYANSERKKIALIVSCITIVIIFSLLTIRQNTIWKDNLTFCTYTIRHAPYSSNICNNLAREYIRQDRLVEAKELLEKAVDLDASNYTAVKNLEIVKIKLITKEAAEKK